MPQTIRISEIVGQPHLEHFNSTKLHQIDKGGRSSVKSSKNEVKCALQMLQDPTCEVAVIRQNHVDHRDTTFAGLKIGFERLGYPLRGKIDYPTGKSGSLYIRTAQGNYVHFAGMNDTDSIKGIRPTKLGNDIKVLWFFEITQFKSEFDMNNVISTFIRGKKDYFMIMYEFNPHPKSSHWTYEWLKKMQKREDCYIKHTNYNDLPYEQQQEWLGELMLQEIEALKEIDYEQYKNIYLGLPANLSGTIYNFNENNHVGVCGLQPYMKIDIGVDYGVTDATAFTCRGTLPAFDGIEIPMIYYHKNGVSVGNKLQEDYINDLFSFCADVYDRYGLPMKIWIDSANKDFKETFRREIFVKKTNYIIIGKLNKLQKLSNTKLGKYEIRQKDISAIQGRINIKNRMLGARFIKYDPSCKELIKATIEAEYNKHQERLDDGTVNVDSLDSEEYSWLNDIDIIDKKILAMRRKQY